MNKQVWFGVLVLLVALGGGIVVFRSSKSESSSSAKRPGKAKARGAQRSNSKASESPNDPPRLGSPKTKVSRIAEQGREADTDVDVHVQDDGTVVRDHRGHTSRRPGRERQRNEAAAPTGLPPTPVRTDIVLAVQKRIKPLVKECAAEHQGAVGEAAKIEAELEVSVARETLVVQSAKVRSENIDGSDMSECVVAAVENLEIDAKGNDDVSHHILTFPLRLPVR